MGSEAEHAPHPSVGETTVTVRCVNEDLEPPFCDGYEETIELEGAVYTDGDRIVFPGFDEWCPGCGDRVFEIDGQEVTFGVN